MFNKTMTGLWRWNLFWWKVEGMDSLNGLNVYRDPSSYGFEVRAGRYGFKVRYSRRVKRWFIGPKVFSYAEVPEWRPFSWSLGFGAGGIQATEEHQEYDKVKEKYND